VLEFHNGAPRYADHQLLCAPSVECVRVSDGVDGVSMEYWSIGGSDRGPQTALNLFTILGNGPHGT
jgi:hypothetical protein